MTKKKTSELDAEVEDILLNFIHTDEDEDATKAINFEINVCSNNLDELQALEEKLTPHLKPGITLREAIVAYLHAEKQS